MLVLRLNESANLPTCEPVNCVTVVSRVCAASLGCGLIRLMWLIGLMA